jgi:putative inorganic carbon (hco3(-)) transporter
MIHTRITVTWQSQPARILALGMAGLALGIAIAIIPLAQIEQVIGITGGIFVVGIILAEPVIGLGLTLFAAPFGPLENITLGLPIESGQIILLVTIGAWLARMILERRMLLTAGRIFWPLALFIVVGMLSFFVSRSFELWAKECVKWIEVLIVYLLALSEAKRSPRARNILITAVLLSALFQACLGIYQFGLRGVGPKEFSILGARFFRAYGTFEQPNPFGGYMGLTWPFAFGVAIFYFQKLIQLLRAHRERVTVLRASFAFLFASSVSLLALIALILSWSRGAWLGAGAAAIVMLFALIRRPFLTLAILGLIVVTILSFNLIELLPPSLLSRLTDFTKEFSSLDVRGVTVAADNFSLIERLAHWQAAQNMIVNNPYLGVGFGNYGAAYEQYRTLNWLNPLGHAHNYYLNIFAETGLLGFLAYVTLWGAVFIHTIRLLKRDKSLTQHGMTLSACIALGLLGSWTQLSMHQLVDNLYVANIFLLLGVYLSFIGSKQDEAQTD